MVFCMFVFQGGEFIISGAAVSKADFVVVVVFFFFFFFLFLKNL